MFEHNSNQTKIKRKLVIVELIKEIFEKNIIIFIDEFSYNQESYNKYDWGLIGVNNNEIA